eukprot:TRINITY_DN10469_c0_g2_i4.p5 TRINITY_DN10469_c0_g2~~TRINITY_DN10469_c0_g2_i4.p5  ORF type:complete len:107 (+),score=3.10 TRINITY_DN10469_c0_g2_i4:256-576(+)
MRLAGAGGRGLYQVDGTALACGPPAGHAICLHTLRGDTRTVTFNELSSLIDASIYTLDRPSTRLVYAAHPTSPHTAQMEAIIFVEMLRMQFPRRQRADPESIEYAS